MVEIMIVVVIVSLLAAIALPAFERIIQQSRFTLFLNQTRSFANGLEIYMMEEGTYPVDTSTGQYNSELVGYVDEADFMNESEFGGKWDIEFDEDDSEDYVVAIGIHFQGVPTPVEDIQRFDELHDDGDLTTGIYRRITSDRYYRIVVDD